MKKERGKHLLFVLLLILGITGNTYVYATEDSGTAAEKLPEVEVMEYVNIREHPTTDARILGHIPGETVLQPLGKEENELGELWYQIRYEGITGYIRGTTVKPAVEENAQEEASKEVLTEEAAEEITKEPAAEEPMTRDAERLPSEEVTETEITEEQTISTQTTREAVHPIDRAAVLFFGGALFCLVPMVLLIRRIRKQQF